VVSRAWVFQFMLESENGSAWRPLRSFVELLENAFEDAFGHVSSSATVDHVLRIDAPAHWDDALSQLSASELEAAQRFYRKVDQQQYVFAHAILRLLLAMRCQVAPSEIRFERGGFGKPVLDYPRIGVHFSISYGIGAIAVAIAETPVGVDIEMLRGDFDLESLGWRCFTEEERLFVGAAASDERRRGFFWLWTRKEALVKATGLGLDAMDSFSALDDRVAMSDESGQVRVFHVHQPPPVPGHALALAVQA